MSWKKSKTNKKICFVAPQAYPVLSNTNHASAGGAEVQQMLLARELLKYGFEISFVVGDYGQKKVEFIDGIRIIKSFKLFAGNRKIRFPWDLAALFRSMHIANADIYFQRASMFYTGGVALFCKLNRKRFVFSAGHDRNCDLGLQKKMNRFVTWFYRFGLSCAKIIIAQSEYQKSLFKKNFNIYSRVIKSGQIIPEASFQKNRLPVILWVGNIVDWKRPELFIELAKRIPDVTFKMVGVSTRNTQYCEGIRNAANGIKNLRFYGFVPYKEIDSYFNEASIFVNTSIAEGFPNTFIQAWLRYVPTVSLNVDPDECICKNNIGIHCGSFQRLVEDSKILLENNQLRAEMGRRAREYAEREHNIQNVVKNYIDIFNSL